MSRTIRDLVHWIGEWWQCDRVRSSPCEGQLLRLTPGAIVVIGPDTLQVAERTVRESDNAVVVSYRCEALDWSGELFVRRIADGTLRIQWHSPEDCLELDVADVEVYSAARNYD